MVLTAAEAESDLYELIRGVDVWALCRRLPDMLTEYDVIALALFGSRARGDHQVDSDIDIAVVMRGCSPWAGHSKRLSRKFVAITYPIELETGLVISALPVPIEYMRDPMLSKKPELYENIKRECLIFWELGEHLNPPSGWHAPDAL